MLDIPKGLAEGVTKEDLEPFADVLGRVSAALIRTGLERYRTEEPMMYQHEGSYIAPSAGDYLTERFPNLRVIGMDFLAVGSPSTKVPESESPVHCHQHLLGYYTGKFCTAIEDMHLSEVPKGKKIKRFFNAPLRIVGLDSSQVVCIAEIED